MGKNKNEGFSKHREDGIAKSSRNMKNGFECIIMNICLSRNGEEDIAKESRNVLNGMSIMNVCLVVLGHITLGCVATFLHRLRCVV